MGIDGFTAAGKTSFGHELAEQISRAGRPTLRPCLDDFKKPWRDRHLYDGVFAFRPEINDYWDFRIWINVDPETSVRRGGERDQYWAGSEAETLHRTRYLHAVHLYLAQVDPLKLVDVVIDNTDFSRPRLLRY